jgi:CRISPR-associated endonuclease/helicase Cas3
MQTGAEDTARLLGQRVEALRGLVQAGEDYDAALAELMEALPAGLASDPLTAAVAREMAKAETDVTVYPAGVVLTARVRPGFFRPEGATLHEPEEVVDDASDADDTTSLRAGALPPVPVTLEKHSEGVARRAACFAEALGLDRGLAEALVRAAQLHDLGKADRRFQALLYGDEPGEALLAKSGRDLDRSRQEAVRIHAGLPRGFRHELVSVALLRKHRGELLGGLDEEQAALAEYLVGTHHGRGRPFMPVIEEAGEEVSLDWDGRPLSASPDHGLYRLEAGWAGCFWHLLRRHGPWGLAYLEALLRLADGARSAEEQQEAGR